MKKDRDDKRKKIKENKWSKKYRNKLNDNEKLRKGYREYEWNKQLERRKRKKRRCKKHSENLEKKEKGKTDKAIYETSYFVLSTNRNS